MSLIELLVVIVIMTTIVAAVIPILSPGGDDRRLREAARGLNTFITGAQTRAIAAGRPYGVAIKRLGADTKRTDDNSAALELYYVEQPPPYAGYEANSRARLSLYEPASANLYNGIRPLVLVQFVTRGLNVAQSQDGLPPEWDADQFPDGVIRPGDVIEINGTRFRLLSDTNDGGVVAKFTTISSPVPGLNFNGYFAKDTGKVGGNQNKATQIVAWPMNDSGQQINVTHDDHGFVIGTADKAYAPFFTSPAPYKILREPAPASDQPYQLPEGVAIDLRASGVGSDDYFYSTGIYDNSDGVLIMFAPEGRVSRVFYSRTPLNNLPFDDNVVDNVYLLLGKRENAPPQDVATDPTLNSLYGQATSDDARNKLREPINWLRGQSQWIVIGSQSGRIATIDNAFVDPVAIINTYTTTPYTLSQNTEELRNQQILAAREFTHEMRQLGGR